ncbi:MAG: glycosyltransferase [Bacteroidales bacterium]|nr:glycosyltransferase [Bacteroidales bacterium]
MKVPMVSVLMPVYRTAPYLREAMDSILSQTFADFELIVLNDCSPDSAEQILDTYHDQRIVRYLGQQNVGLANVLNTGLDMARGKYIARMDSDDISLPTRLALQVAYMEAHPEVDLCSAAMQLFGDRHEIWQRSQDAELVKIDALFHSPVLHPTCVWRRESFERNNLRYRQTMVPAEDYDLWTRALICGLTLTNLPDVLYRYRIHPGQATARPNQMEQKVRQGYIKVVLTSLSHRQIERFPHCIAATMLANCRTRFFSPTKLLKRLIKVNLNSKR